MGISLRSLTGKETFTMREVAIDRGFDYLPFSQRELVTPQLGFERSKEPPEGAPEPDTRPGSHPDEAADKRPGEQEELHSAGNVRWANWLDDFPEENSTRLEPENKTQLRKAMVNMLDVDGAEAEVRSVGSGHSHSKAAEPSSSFIDLRRMRNESGTLSHGPGEHGYLEVDEEMSDPTTTYIFAPHSLSVHPLRVEKENLARLKGGTVLKQLNRNILPSLGDTDELAPGKALYNMGAWDGQTIAGAINTGTHGTGLDLGAVSDAVRSVEIATVPETRSGVPIVQLFRIEPEGGITDREKFEADAGDHEMRLIQDDDVFHSAVVGYGCMGNVFHYTLEVRDSYWVQEVPQVRRLESAYDGFEEPKIATPDQGLLDDLRVEAEEEDQFDPTTKEDVIDFITSDPETGRNTRHLRLFVNLPMTQGEPSRVGDVDDPICLEVRKREVQTKSEPDNWGSITADDRWPPERPKDEDKDFGYWAVGPPHPLGEGARKRGNYAKSLRNRFFANRTTGSPPSGDGTFRKGWWRTAWYIGLRRLRDRGNFPPTPPPDAISTAVAVPIENLAPAIWDVIKLARSIKQDRPYDPDRTREKDWNVFFSAPLGIRFVAGTRHHLSPEFDEDRSPEYAEADDPEPRAMVELPFPIQDGFNRQPRIGSKDYPKLSKEDVRDRVAKPALKKIERKLVEDHDGRPHMGKHFTLDRDDLADLYPRFEGEGGWLQTYRRFNAFGTFNNDFTEQLGISRDKGLPENLTPIPSATATPDEESERQETSAPTEDDEKTSTATPDEGSERQETSAPSEEADGTSTTSPGLGILTGLSGIGAAAWLHKRLRDDDDDEES